MKNGELLLGSGEDFQGGLKQLSSDDVSRNRDRNIIPRFFTVQVKTVDGFQEVEYLELLIPGDAKSSPCHLVDDRLRERYASNYRAFKENRELPTEGTAVEVWLGAGDARVHMLRSMHLRTVENVADMSDTTIAAIGMGGRELKNRAIAFLEVQKSSGVADELAAKDDVIEQLKERLAKLEAGGTSEEEVAGDSVQVDDLKSRAPAGASAVGANKAPPKRRK